MQKHIYFLAGLPRSGSTLLAALLSQRDDTYVSPTSSLADTLGQVVASFEQNPASKAEGMTEEDLYRTMMGMVTSKYSERKEEFIFDKGRQWPLPIIQETMEKVLGEPLKIISTVRSINECLASFAKLEKPDDIRKFCRDGHLAAHLFNTYKGLKSGYEQYPENFLFIEYDDLCSNPQEQLDRVADFLVMPSFTYNTQKIETVEEKDEAWGIKGLHFVRPRVRKRTYDPKKILGAQWEFYSGGNFWRDDEPEKEKSPIDFMLEAGLRGDLEEGEKIGRKLMKKEPENDRVAFNMGWYELMLGNLQKGHTLLDRGRGENVFGNKHIGSRLPLWEGQRDSTVILNLEGGLGDQIHGAKFVKDIAEYNCKVIISCSGELAPILKDIEGVSAVCQHGNELGIYHDYWVPSMSAVVPLKYEYSDLKGTPYIERSVESKGKIGLKWAGNPAFEHEQHREFEAQLMFDAVENQTNCISLQKDYDDKCPSSISKAKMDTWEDTLKAVSECDLIISSCTSVAHLAAAMGIETWMIIPILPYYLWALPGDKTPYYDSVTLFRQEEYGNWEAPFTTIKNKLKERNESRNIT